MIKKHVINKSSLAKLYFLLLCVCFVFLSVSLLSDQIDKYNRWDTYARYDFEIETVVNEDGTVDKYKLISSPEQLAGAFMEMEDQTVKAIGHADIFKYSNNQYKLTKNINLSGKEWVPGTNSGTIDGCGYYITGIEVYKEDSDRVGFISQNLSGSIIKNLSVEIDVQNDYMETNTSYTGGLVAINWGTITKCNIVGGYVYGPYFYDRGSAFSSNISRHVGGICGYNMGTIEYCTNNAEVWFGTSVGGISGYQNNNGIIKNCYNYGFIATDEGVYTRGGGICGINSGELSYCLNTGNVYVTKYIYETTGEAIAGGIVGMSDKDISFCGNTGYVEANSCNTANSYAGGIAGYTKGKIKYCYNIASISAYSDEKTITNLGEDGEKLYTDIWKAANTSFKYKLAAQIWILEYEDIGEWAYAGGIAGYTSTSITNCYSWGEIEGGKVTTTYHIREGLGSIKISSNKYMITANYSIDHYLEFDSASFSQSIATTTSSFSCCYSNSDTSKSFNNNCVNVVVADTSNNNSSTILFDETVSIASNETKKISSSDSHYWEVSVNNASFDYSDYPDGFNTVKVSTYAQITGTSFEIYSKHRYTDDRGKKSAESKTLLYELQTKLTFARCSGISESSLKSKAGANKISSTYFAYDPNINDGFPHIKEFYWIHEATK